MDPNKLDKQTGLFSVAIVNSTRDRGDAPELRWNAFHYGLSTLAHGRAANESMTNLPRSGESGLPKEWTFRVDAWHATVTEPVDRPEVRDFLAACEVVFKYNRQDYGTTTLLDLVAGPQKISDLMMRENVSFGARIACHKREALVALQRYLTSTDAATWKRPQEAVAAALRTTARNLEINAPITDRALNIYIAEIREAAESLSPARELVIGLHLDGLLKAVVY